MNNNNKSYKDYTYDLILYHPEEYLPMLAKKDEQLTEADFDFMMYSYFLSKACFNGSFALHKETGMFYFRLSIDEDVDMVSFIKKKFPRIKVEEKDDTVLLGRRKEDAVLDFTDIEGFKYYYIIKIEDFT